MTDDDLLKKVRGIVTLVERKQHFEKVLQWLTRWRGNGAVPIVSFSVEDETREIYNVCFVDSCRSWIDKELVILRAKVNDVASRLSDE